MDPKAFIYGLYSCPYSCDNPNDCQLHKERKECKSFDMWYKFINTLTISEILNIYNEHRKCLCIKEK